VEILDMVVHFKDVALMVLLMDITNILIEMFL
jgi:hypothetical protein